MVVIEEVFTCDDIYNIRMNAAMCTDEFLGLGPWLDGDGPATGERAAVWAGHSGAD